MFKGFLPFALFFLDVDFESIVWNGLLRNFKGTLVFMAFKALQRRISHVAPSTNVTHDDKYGEEVVSYEPPGRMHTSKKTNGHLDKRALTIRNSKEESGRRDDNAGC